jgi:hypothetical protein
MRRDDHIGIDILAAERNGGAGNMLDGVHCKDS